MLVINTGCPVGTVSRELGVVEQTRGRISERVQGPVRGRRRRSDRDGAGGAAAASAGSV